MASIVDAPEERTTVDIILWGAVQWLSSTPPLYSQLSARSALSAILSATLSAILYEKPAAYATIGML
jgi:hypothetical protein